MKKTIFAIPVILGSMFISPVQSSIISHIDKTELSGAGLNYYYTIDFWDYDDETRNPCFSYPRCSIRLSHRHNSDGTSGGATTEWSAKGIPCVSKSATIGELGVCLRDNPSDIIGLGGVSGIKITPPYSGVEFHGNQNPAVSECVGLFYSINGPEPSVYGKPMLPSSACGTAPPVDIQCKVIEGAIDLDHGKKEYKNIDGDVAYNDLTVNCEGGKAKVSFLFSNLTNDFLTLSDSIKSKLTINDKPLGFVFDADEGDNKFTLKSTLSLNGKLVAGEFENMSVMIVSYQ